MLMFPTLVIIAVPIVDFHNLPVTSMHKLLFAYLSNRRLNSGMNLILCYHKLLVWKENIPIYNTEILSLIFSKLNLL